LTTREGVRFRCRETLPQKGRRVISLENGREPPGGLRVGAKELLGATSESGKTLMSGGRKRKIKLSEGNNMR